MPNSVDSRVRQWIPLLALAACLTPVVVRAQAGQVGTGGIDGTVRDSLGLPVGGAQITLTGSDMRVESDERGEFKLAKATAGRLTIRVRRIGFRPDSTEVMVLAGQTIPVEMILGRLAIEMRPVVVLGRRDLAGRMGGFYDRQLRGGGHFITRDQIDKRNPINTTDLFRTIPGARVESGSMVRNRIRFRNSRCAPLTWLDGMPLYAGEFDLDALDPRSLEGIEIYSGPASVPAQFSGNRSMSSSCGTVIIWSRQGELRAKKRKPGELSAAQQIEEFVLQQSVFTADQVDDPARPDSSRLVRPVYPDSLFVNGIPGRVLAEFVVNAAGDVVEETFSIVTTTHLSLIETVRRAVKDQRYIPARRKGKAVQQVVQQPFSFVPDSLATRRR
jgi:hypothetical protein